MADKGHEGRKVRILVYALDRHGIKSCPKLETENWVLEFENYKTELSFDNYDGLILFGRTFETHEEGANYYREWFRIHEDSNELTRRKKQFRLLMEKGGFCCFLLSEPIIDSDDEGDKRGSDLSKYCLNIDSFHRNGIDKPLTAVRVIRNEFLTFLKKYGAAHNLFNHYNDQLEKELKPVCYVGNELAGFIISNSQYFLPTVRLDQRDFAPFFTSLADALVHSRTKVLQELPKWVSEFQFVEEKTLQKKKSKYSQFIQEINLNLDKYAAFKKSLCCSGEELVESVDDILENGFAFQLGREDNYIEDRQIINAGGEPEVLIEIKGSNGNIKRENINQADSHRERNGLPDNFPSVLIVNTFIKDSSSLRDKDKAIEDEQIKHAVKMKVLMMRTLDLLHLLALKDEGKLTTEEILQIFKVESGWLKVSDNRHHVIKAK